MSCLASEFLNHSIFELPSHGSACLTDLGAVDDVESNRGTKVAQGSPAVVAEREVRDLRTGTDGAGHPTRGGRPGGCGPVDGGADLPYRQAGCVGRVGRFGAGPGRGQRRAGVVGAGAGRGGPVAGHGGRAGRGAASARGKTRLGLMAGPVPVRVHGEVKAGLLDLVAHAVEHGWSARRACALLGLDHARFHHWVGRRGPRPPRGPAPPRRPGGRAPGPRAVPGGPGWWTGNAPRSWSCSTPGAVSTGRTASWPIAAPASIWCTCRSPRCGGGWPPKGWSWRVTRRVNRRRGRTGRTGWSGSRTGCGPTTSRTGPAPVWPRSRFWTWSPASG